MFSDIFLVDNNISSYILSHFIYVKCIKLFCQKYVMLTWNKELIN